MSIRRSRKATLAVAAAVVALGALATPAPATAEVTLAQAASSCPVDELCVWTTSPFSGHFGSFAFGAHNLATFNGGALDRAITDVWNRSDVNFCLWDRFDYFGNRLVVSPTSQGHYVGAAWNDRARSLHVC